MTYDSCIAQQYYNGNHWFKGAALEKYLQNLSPPNEIPFPWIPLQITAFHPKQFNVTISRDRPCHNFTKEPYSLFQYGDNAVNRFAPDHRASKLAFDVSPFPPREE